MSGATSPEAETIIRQTQQINTLMGQSADRIERVQRQLDSAYAAQQRFEQAQSAVNAAVERGRISQERGNQLLELARQRYQQAGAAAQAFAVANDNAARGSRNFGSIIGQAGFQVQDFAVQVASGQSALTAFVQQGSQLLGVFGTAGAIAGAVLAVGGIAAQLILGRSASQQFNDAMRQTEERLDRMAAASRRARDGAQELAQSMREQAERLAALPESQRAFETERLQATLDTLNRSRDRLLGQAQSDAGLEGLLRATQASGIAAQRLGREVPQQVQMATAAILEFRAVLADGALSAEQTSTTIARLASRLTEAAGTAGPMRAELLRAVEALDALYGRGETLDTNMQRVRAILAALGDTAGRTTQQVADLSAEMARLARVAQEDMGSENLRAVERARERAQAIARGVDAARLYDAEARRRDNADRYYDQQRSADERRLREGGMSEQQAREDLMRTDAARRETAEARARLESENDAALARAELAARNARAGTASARRETRADERSLRERNQLIASLDEEEAANIRLEESLKRIAEARRRGQLSEEEATRYTQMARSRREQEIVRANDKSELDAAQIKQTTQLASDLGSAFSTAFDSAITGGSNLSDILKQLEQDLLRLVTRSLVTQPLSQFLTGSVQGWLGGSGSGVAGALGGLGSMGGSEIVNASAGLLKSATAAVLHDGGVVGIDGGRRTVPMDIFLDAPRYHSGGWAGERPFANDEVPAILRRGEVVLNESQQRAVAGGGVNQTIIVKTDDPGAFNRSRGQIAAAARRDIARARRNA